MQGEVDLSKTYEPLQVIFSQHTHLRQTRFSFLHYRALACCPYKRPACKEVSNVADLKTSAIGYTAISLVIAGPDQTTWACSASFL